MYDWIGDEVPAEIVNPLEFFLTCLLFDPDKITPLFNKDTLTIDIDGYIIKVPMKLRERINK